MLTIEAMKERARLSKDGWYWAGAKPLMGVHWDRSRQQYSYFLGCTETPPCSFAEAVEQYQCSI